MSREEYREVKEIIIRGRERERLLLVPVPKMDGHWMMCHQAVVVTCPECGSTSGIPCQTNQGHVAITRAMASTVRRLMWKEKATQNQLQRLRERFKKIVVYRAQLHNSRKRAWVKAGLRVGVNGRGF